MKKTISYSPGHAFLEIEDAPIEAAIEEIMRTGAEIDTANGNRVSAMLKCDFVKARELVGNGWSWRTEKARK